MADTNEMSSEQQQHQRFGLPGFRFHPTEEELVEFYLKNMIFGKKLSLDVIGYLNIYRYDPRELPRLAKTDGEREWYFYVPRDRKHGSNGRPNRTTEKGFWKATGSDRKIWRMSEPKRQIGLRKTLVFYQGRAPRGTKTDWVMNEYRLPDSSPLPKSIILQDIVLCKIYRKATPLRVLEQRAGMEEQQQQFFMNETTSTTMVDTNNFKTNFNHTPLSSSSSPSMDTATTTMSMSPDPWATTSGPLHEILGPMPAVGPNGYMPFMMKTEAADLATNYNDDGYYGDDGIGDYKTVPSAADVVSASCTLLQQFPPPAAGAEGKVMNHCKLPELQVPSKLSVTMGDWSQDPFCLISPWLHQNLTPLATLLNL
ncbi:unnamed protein product [Linum tenue]|uniref:NAC domain-containing protein n=1 Tax=Linum tenue TaxID=586396 RepID=A0AAV0PDC4_9ROSI|nr:unnamed protein product [Linum tenue]